MTSNNPGPGPAHRPSPSPVAQGPFRLLSAVGLILILIVTLFPYGFGSGTEPGGFIARISLIWFKHPGDFLLNIILFVPLGLGLGGLAQGTRGLRLRRGLLVLATCCLVSLSIEAAQLFLPTRTPSAADLLANGLGSLAGIMLVPVVSRKAEKSATAQEGRRSVRHRRARVASIAAYVLVLASVVRDPTSLLSFTDWDASFPLALGNELTGDRPWAGTVSELTVWNRALSRDEIRNWMGGAGAPDIVPSGVVCRFPLLEPDDLRDVADMVPDLRWVGDEPIGAEGAGVRVGDRRWLKTLAPAVDLSRELRRSSRFTLAFVASTAGLSQEGPARIVSLSADPYRRNFTVGQEREDLVVRIRTPLTGSNGRDPEFVARGVFMDRRTHRYCVTYDGRRIALFVDDVAGADDLELWYGAALHRLFPRFDPHETPGYRAVFFLLCTFPLLMSGYLLGERRRR